MNDNDVIKGLAELVGSDNPGKLSIAVRLFLEDVLTCINRLQAENEKWQSVVFKQDEIRQMLAAEKQGYLDELQYANAEIERLQKNNEYILMQHAFQRRPDGSCWNDVIEKAKSEARKEFAERLMNATVPVVLGGKYHYDVITKEGIDNFLKELDGKENI